jgi:uncharacterized membrane protein YfcA
VNEFLLAAPLAFLVGVSLGLLGGGGSILAVPILVYVLHLEPKSAIATSLAVVGITALVGAARHARHGNLAPRVGLGFGAAGILGASLGSRAAAWPAVPGEALLAAFALLMIVVAVMMFVRQGREPGAQTRPRPASLSQVAGYGFLTGLLTGLLGVGGGFIIVPALLLAARLPMHLAVGTSLLVIAMDCAAGLVGFLGRVPVQWGLAGVFGVASVAGSVVGAGLARRTQAARLRTAFAGFLLVAGAAMLVEQGLRLWRG